MGGWEEEEEKEDDDEDVPLLEVDPVFRAAEGMPSVGEEDQVVVLAGGGQSIEEAGGVSEMDVFVHLFCFFVCLGREERGGGWVGQLVGWVGGWVGGGVGVVLCWRRF